MVDVVEEKVVVSHETNVPRPRSPWRGRVTFILSLLAGVALLALVWRVYNHYAWEWGSRTTHWLFSNGPVPFYAYWRVQPLWPIDALWPRILPWAFVLPWVGLVAWQWRRACRGRRGVAWAIVPASVAFAFAINCSTAMMDGQAAEQSLTMSFQRRGLEYWGDVPRVRDRPMQFIAEYPKIQRRRDFFGGRFWISIHGATHPPGPTLILWASKQMFGPRTYPAALMTIALSSLAPAATWWLAQAVARLARLRRPRRNALAVGAVGIAVLSPSIVLYGATCVDGIFVAPLIASTAAVLAAYACRRWWQAIAVAVGAGLLVSLSLMLTFATACLAVPFGMELLLNSRRKRDALRRLAVLATVMAVVTLVYVILYWTIEFDVIATLRSAMWRNDFAVGTGYETVSRYLDTSLAHCVAFTIGAGFAATWLWTRGAAAAGWRLVRGRSDSGDKLAIAFFASVLVLAFSTLFTLEVERVWMWLVPAVAVAAAAQVTRRFAAAPWVWAVVVVMLLQYAQTWAIERWMWTLW